MLNDAGKIMYLYLRLIIIKTVNDVCLQIKYTHVKAYLIEMAFVTTKLWGFFMDIQRAMIKHMLTDCLTREATFLFIYLHASINSRTDC